MDSRGSRSAGSGDELGRSPARSPAPLPPGYAVVSVSLRCGSPSLLPLSRAHLLNLSFDITSDVSSSEQLLGRPTALFAPLSTFSFPATAGTHKILILLSGCV